MTRRTLWLVVRREWKAGRKPFLISSAIVLAVVAIAMTIFANAQRAEEERPVGATHQLGLIGETPPDLAEEMRRRLPADDVLAVVRLNDVSQAEDELAVGDLDAVVVGDSTVLWSAGVSRVFSDGLVDSLHRIEARERASTLGVSIDEVDWMLEDHLRHRLVEPVEESNEIEEAASAIAVILMFVAIMAYGQWIGYSVADEKGSRVIELILGAVPPHHLLTGKLLAVGTMGLSQLAMVGSVVLGYGIYADLITLPDLTAGLVVWMLIWFLLGFAMYGSVYAAGGSLAADTHEASTTLGLLNIIPIIGYAIGLASFSQGSDTALLRAMSLIPLWSPMIMPGRAARDWAAPAEVVISIVLMIAAVYGIIRLAGWAYRGGVARSGSRLRWMEAIRTGRDLSSRAAGRK